MGPVSAEELRKPGFPGDHSISIIFLIFFPALELEIQNSLRIPFLRNK